MSHSPRTRNPKPRAKRQEQSRPLHFALRPLPLAGLALLVALCALPFIARTEAAPSESSLITHNSSRNSRYSWLGDDADVYTKILSSRSARILSLLGPFAVDELYWDANGATAGTGGTGTWTSANTWRLGSNVGTLQTWVDGNNAHFQGTAGIVTITGGTTVSPVTSFFELTGFTLRPSNTSLTTLAGSNSLSASVNLNYLSSADTADRQLAIGSTTGGAGSGFTFAGGQITTGSNARIFLSQASESIDVPVTISGVGSTFAGFIASNTGTGITGTIANSSSFTTLLGATSGNDLTLSSAAVISGTAGLRIGVTNSGANVGAVTLNAVNTYGGGTTLDGGTLVLGNNSALSSSTLTLSSSSTSVLQAGGGARTLANNIIWGGSGTISGSNPFTFNGSFTSSGSDNRSLTVSNTGGVNLAGNVFLSEIESATRALTINGASAVTISGLVTNNSVGNTLGSRLIYNGSNTLTLSNTNTYTGNTLVSGGGTISVSTIGNSGANGNVGAGTTINLGSAGTSGTLLYNGTGENTSKIINLLGSTGGATIDQSGIGLLKFTGTNTATAVGGTRTLTLQGSTAGTGEIAGAIVNGSGTVALTKAGSGTWTLSGANTYTAATTINAGTLLVNGSTAAGSAVTVNSGATLGGTGTVAGSVTVNSGATLAPGVSPGILNTGDVVFTSGSNFNVEINGTTVGTQYDQLNVTGGVTLGGATLNVTLGFTPAAGNAFTIINNDDTDPVSPQFAGLPQGGTFNISGTTFQISYTGGTNNDVVLTVLAPPDLTIADISQAEGHAGTTTMSFTVTRSGDLSGTSTVNYSTTAGTATQGPCSTVGNDYQSASGMLTFSPTDDTETITVTICGDTPPEPDETFTVQLATPSNATISDATATGTIQNDDGAVTYTWNPTTLTALALCAGQTTSWICPANWDPLRPTAATANTTDILIFDGSPSVTPGPLVTNVPSQTIRAIQFKNGLSEAKFEATLSPATLTINGDTGSDFSIEAGSTVRLQGTNAITIALTAADQEGIIAGSLIFQGAAHQLTGANAGEIVFQSGSIFTTTTGFSGHPFGSGTNLSVSMAGGSNSFYGAGLDPFGGAGKEIVSFGLSPMSNQEFSASTAFDSNGRIYGNLTLTGSSQAFSGSGSNPLVVSGNFVLDSASTLTLSGTAGGDMVVNGNFTDSNTSSSAFQSNGRIVKFQGGIATQTIFKAGGIGEIFSHVNILKTGGSVKLLEDININGHLLFDGVAGSAVDVLELNGQGVSLPGTISAVPDANSGFKGDVNGAGMFIGTNASPLGAPIHFVSGGEFLSLFFVDRASGASVDTDLTIGHPTTTPNGNLTLTNGVLDMGIKTLTLNPNASISRTSGYVSGNLKKIFGATGNFTFAVGTGTSGNYSPVDANVQSGVGNSLTVKAVAGPQPNIPGPNKLQRYWVLSNSGAVTAHLTFHYLNSDVIGSESLYKIFKYDGSFTQFTPDATGVNSATDHFATLNNVSSFSDWTLAEPSAVFPPYVVNTTNDVNDGTCDATHCSLREAILAANSNADTSTITFNIPNSDPGFANGVFTIQPTPTELPTITQRVNLDGATQTTFTGDTNADGPEVVINGSLLTGSPTGLFASTGAANSVISNLVVNGFAGAGVVVWGNNIQVLNNYIGTDATGTSAVPNGAGLGVGASASPTSGYVISGNLISGNSGGISSCDLFSGTFTNNKIGTDRTGVSNVGNTGLGFVTACTSFTNVTISNNTIAFNGGDGFRDVPDYTNVPPYSHNHPNIRITQNSIFNNGGIGINLKEPPDGSADGVTPNDNQDPDVGGNHLQNFPVLATAKVTGTTYTVTGTLNTTPSSTSGYTIELFKSSVCDGNTSGVSSGTNGEGQTYLGSVVTGNTNASGDVAFTFNSPTAFAVGDIITATATDVNGNTSEFSTCLAALAGTPGSLQFAAANTNNTETNSSSHTVDIAVTRTGGSDGAVSVDYQVTNGTATTADNDYSISPSTGTLNWADGDSANKLITITVNGDTTYEANEIVNLALSNAQVASLGSPNTATLTITNDDAPLATIVVNTTNDIDDGFCSPAHTSLREAINCANFSTDTSAIEFNIPLADSGYSGVTGVFTIQVSGTPLPEITRRVTIDGATQTTFSGNTNANGPEVVINGSLLTGSPTGLYASTGAANSVISNLVVNGFAGAGVVVWGNNIQVLNNYIGTDATGTSAVPNGAGLGVGASASPTSGYVISGNLISGNSGGISNCDLFSGTFTNNKIGTDRTGVSNLGNVNHGFITACTSFRDTTISNNIIAFNGGDGFRDVPDYTNVPPYSHNHPNNRLTQNSIFNNGGIGINLKEPPDGSADGVTPNDNQDPDVGGNHLQNFPVITSAGAGGLYPITGTLNTTPSSTSGYTIEFFKSSVCDGNTSGVSSGTNGEGQTYLGSVVTGNTNASGDVAFTFNSPIPFNVGDIITATAADTNGNTSEFSACFTATAANAAPVWITTSATVAEPTGTEANPIQRTATLQVNEANDGQSLTFSLTGGTGQCGATPVAPFTGFGFSPNPVTSAAGNESTNMTFNVGANDAAGSPYCVRVTVNDGFGDVTQDITVNVTAANSSPVASNDAYATNENTPLNVIAPGVLTNDTDVDSGQTRTAIQVTGPSHAASFTLNPDGSFAYTPVTGYAGPDTFTYKARDNSGDAATQDSNTATVTITVNATECTPAPADMVAWWPGDGNAHDIKGVNNGTLQNGATFAAGKVNQAFSFDGNDDEVVIPHNAAQNSAQITIDAWINQTTSGNGRSILNKRTAGNLGGFALETLHGVAGINNGIAFCVWVGGTVTCSLTPSDVITNGTWHHVAGTYDGSNMRVFVDGIQQALTPLTGAIDPSSEPMKIGRNISTPTFTFHGMIDEVELFNRALSADEVQAIAGHGSFGKCRTCTTPPTGMVSWWDASGSAPTANDIADGNPGTLQDGAIFTPGKVGQGFSFNGTTAYVSVGNDAVFDFTNAMTVDAWVKSDGLTMTFAPIVAKGDAAWRLQTYGNLNVASFGTTGLSDIDLVGTTNIIDGQWHHVAGVFDGATKYLYVDGVLEASVAVSGSISVSGDEVRIGGLVGLSGFSTDRFWTGSIDEVQLFNRALSASEIAAIANAGNAGKCHTSTVTVAVSPSSVLEDGGTNLVYTFTRNGDISGAMPADFTVGGSATFGGPNADYTQTGAGSFSSSSGSVTFAAGSATATVTIDPADDLTDEPDEDVVLTITSGSGYTIGSPNTATGTITDDDPAPSITINDVSLAEGSGGGTTAFVFTVSLSNQSSSAVDVTFTTADNTAKTTDTPTGDYTLNTGTLTIPANTSSGQITVQVGADTKLEPNETFFVNLTGATNGTITDNQGIGTIQNDDAGPVFSIDNVSMSEGNSGTTNFVFTVTKTGTTGQRSRVDFATANGTTNPATGGASCPGSDYVSQSGTLTFTPTEMVKTITVAVCGDATYELNDTFFVNLSNAVNASISTGQGLGTITNDDAQPTFSIDDRSNNEGTMPVPLPSPTPLQNTTQTFTVTKTGSTAVTATVNFGTADGSATGNTAPCPSGFDYQTQTGSLSFLPNETTKTIIVPVCKDPDFEGNETFFVNLTGETHATLADGQGQGTILNDDIPSGGFVVTATDDLDDSICAPAPGHCSLREAITAANGSSTAVAITFAIPAGDPRHFYYQDDGAGSPNGQVTLANVTTTIASDDSTIVGIDPDWPHSWWSILPTSQLQATTKQVFINGDSQTGAVFNTLTTGTNAILRIEINGASAGPNATGLTISGGTSTVRGLVINRFQRDGSAPTPTGNGLSLPSGNNTISGNFIGTDVTGTLDVGSLAVLVTGSGISTTSFNNVIGGATPDVVNLIAGNDRDGISFSNSNTNVIRGNLIGTRANGTSALGNGASGLSFTGLGSVANTVGGPDTGQANTIAFNGSDGVSLSNANFGNSIRGNSIFSNGTTNLHLGIDLGVDGLTGNDALDGDSGPNGLQNFPVITSAIKTGSTNTINGTLNSTPAETFIIDFYKNLTCDDSGNGEGKIYLGSMTTGTTNGSGDVSFTYHPTPSTALAVGDVITATATRANFPSETSEFSACVTVVDGSAGAGNIQFTSPTYSVNENGVSAAITLTRVGGSNGSISATFTTSNGTADTSDYSDADQTVTFLEGETSKTINITINDDTTYEGDETVLLALSTPSVINASLSDDKGSTKILVDPHSAVLTIIENDPLNMFARDGSAAEPASGTSQLLFTVILSTEASSPITVDYATADGGGTPATGGVACGGSVDYESTNGNLTFAVGERIKTVAVNICGDGVVEPDETFLLNLTNAGNATLMDAQAVGTITQTNAGGALQISELRSSGPNGSADDFVEIYNNGDAQHVVASVDGSAGYGLFKMGANCNATPVLIGTIQNGTPIPARGHYLFTGQAYSLASYAASDRALGADLDNDANVALFSTANVANLSTATRLDAVGFGTNTGGGVCDLMREGATLAPVAGSVSEHSYFRKLCDFVQGVGCTTPGNPKDTNNNAADFLFADTAPTTIPGIQERLGAPGPENLDSPVRRDPAIQVLLLDATALKENSPNRVRDANNTPPNADFGTLSVRRRILNTTGGNVTRLRFRIVDITGYSTSTSIADLRMLDSTSMSIQVSGVNDPATCTASGAGSPTCTVTVKGTTLEPPNQSSGGGWNSTVAEGTITTLQPLAPGASTNVQFLLGVQRTGTYRMLIIVEAKP